MKALVLALALCTTAGFCLPLLASTQRIGPHGYLPRDVIQASMDFGRCAAAKSPSVARARLDAFIQKHSFTELHYFRGEAGAVCPNVDPQVGTDFFIYAGALAEGVLKYDDPTLSKARLFLLKAGNSDFKGDNNDLFDVGTCAYIHNASGVRDLLLAPPFSADEEKVLGSLFGDVGASPCLIGSPKSLSQFAVKAYLRSMLAIIGYTESVKSIPKGGK